MLEFMVRRLPPKPSAAFTTYWRFAAERQDIWIRRLRSEQPPWTHDEYLRKFKFTNPYRATDRTSQYLIGKVLYEGPQDPEEILFRTILFKLFNNIGTWQYLTDRYPAVIDAFSVDAFGSALDELMASGRTVYSAAYIMPPTRSSSGGRKHHGHLLLLRRMLEDNLAERLQSCRSMSEAFRSLLSYKGVGEFLAYQYITDLNYSSFLNFSECEFVCPGPGAIRGIRKCFLTLGEYSLADTIRWTYERQADEFAARDLQFTSLCGRDLQYIDCQNLYCEVDKYTRVALPALNREGEPHKVKQRFRPHGSLPRPWFPPKWGINDRLFELAGRRLSDE